VIIDVALARIQELLWEGDIEALQAELRCECCCAEHTFEGCPARLWGGCRGQDTMTRADIELWAAHYGMTREQFLQPFREE
jgi:hypothetical protein